MFRPRRNRERRGVDAEPDVGCAALKYPWLDAAANRVAEPRSVAGAPGYPRQRPFLEIALHARFGSTRASDYDGCEGGGRSVTVEFEGVASSGGDSALVYPGQVG